MAWFYITGDAMKVTAMGWFKFCPGPLCAKSGHPAYPGSKVSGEWKHESEFGVSRARPGKRNARCKACVEYSRAERGKE